MPYIDLFPKVPYDVNREQYSNYTVMTNLLFRFGIIKSILNNISAYIIYTIKDGDTPEILAEKVYNDPEAHWIIVLANDIIDPQFDWPLEDSSFRKYITAKYGSIANAKTTIHHYEMVIQREESLSGTIHETRFVVDYDTLTDAVLTLETVSGDFGVGNTVWSGTDIANATFSGNTQAWSNSNGYLRLANTSGNIQLYTTINSNTSNGIITDIVYPEAPYSYYRNLPETQGVETFNIEGRTIVETTSREAISNFDWEQSLNEKKREIKLIKPVYYPQIIRELDDITKHSRNPFLRTLG